jgi:hypothetical protein
VPGAGQRTVEKREMVRRKGRVVRMERIDQG